MDIMAIDVFFSKKVAEGFEGQQSCILPQARRSFCTTHPLCKKLYITDIGFYPRATFHNRERLQGCPQHILIYCIKGEGWYQLNGKQFKVNASQFFILPAGQPHEYGADSKNPWSIYWVHFAGEQADYLSRFLSPKKTAGPITTGTSPLRHMLFDDILQHLEFMNNLENIVYANSSLYAFLISFKEIQLETLRKKENPIQEVIKLMKKNVHRNMSLEEMANAVNISPSHLSALFKKKTKYSPINLFTSFKIQKASQLLMESRHTIKTIAYNLGYDDPYHFSRVFKKIMGVSPKKFKENAT